MNKNVAKKIAFCINQIHDGGAERVIVSVANYFALHDIDVYMITSAKYDDDYHLDDKVRRIVLDADAKKCGTLRKNIIWIKEIRSLCKTEKIDCIVSFLRESNVRALVSSIGLKTLSVISVRGEPKVEYGGRAGSAIKTLLLPLADGCVLQMDGEKTFFPQKLQKKTTVIPNGISDLFFDVQRSPENHLVIGVGRLDKIKNFPMLINAVQEASLQIPDIRLEIYGIGEEQNSLERLIAENNLSDKVCLMGATHNMDLVYSKADLFVLSSNSEGMPNALMEAMASGVPCISADCPIGAPRYLLCDGECGMLVGVNDHSGLAEAIVKCFSDEHMLCNMGEKARERARDFRSELVLNKWKDFILNDVLKCDR